MNTIFVHLITGAIITRNFINNTLECKNEITKYYGLMGYTKPIPYQTVLDAGLNKNPCPGIIDSCCTNWDFQYLQENWYPKAENIKRYFSKIFFIIKDIVNDQHSIFNIERNLKGYFFVCKNINVSYFNSHINHNDLISYLETSLQSMAFLQKGFYCAICNADNHKYFGHWNEMLQPYIQISRPFCSKLIYYLKEFLVFKTQFMDPLNQGLNEMINCLQDKQQMVPPNDYQTDYNTIYSCLQNGDDNCEYVCSEFVLGSSSQLFLGTLEYYESIRFKIKFLMSYQKLLNKIDSASQQTVISDNNEQKNKQKEKKEEKTDNKINKNNTENQEKKAGDKTEENKDKEDKIIVESNKELLAKEDQQNKTKQENKDIVENSASQLKVQQNEKKLQEEQDPHWMFITFLFHGRSEQETKDFDLLKYVTTNLVDPSDKDNLHIDLSLYQKHFFLSDQLQRDIKTFKYLVVNDFRSNWSKVMDSGLDLFKEAQQSNFYLMNAYSTYYIKQAYYNSIFNDRNQDFRWQQINQQQKKDLAKEFLKQQVNDKIMENNKDETLEEQRIKIIDELIKKNYSNEDLEIYQQRQKKIYRSWLDNSEQKEEENITQQNKPIEQEKNEQSNKVGNQNEIISAKEIDKYTQHLKEVLSKSY